MSFSAKQKSIAILPKPFSFLSLIGSTHIVYQILKNPIRRRTVQYQILLGLSLVDILGSIGMFLGTWPIPAYVNDDKPTVYLASGNDRTCAAQGFLLQAYVVAPIYNASLSLYYVFVVKLGWNENKLKKVRWWFHVFPIGIGLGTAIAAMALNIYGNATWWCWISPEWDLYRWTFFFGIIWFMGLVVVIPSMFMLYLHVRKQEAAAAKWRPGSSQEEQFSQSRKVATRGLLFSLSYIITWIFPTLTRLVQAVNGEIIFPLVLMTAIISPSQGLFNALIFLHPKYIKYRQEKKQTQASTCNCNEVCVDGAAVGSGD
mmetsp:Transcript_26721/g.49147  ORF Transcript_26721/g.49147 Transcript_26721/m.49147 type:complete len:315 (-) Transcript_26721:305-1249(-)